MYFILVVIYILIFPTNKNPRVLSLATTEIIFPEWSLKVQVLLQNAAIVREEWIGMNILLIPNNLLYV